MIITVFAVAAGALVFGTYGFGMFVLSPILIGAAKPAHILNRAITVRGVVNMTSVAVVEAQVVQNG